MTHDRAAAKAKELATRAALGPRTKRRPPDDPRPTVTSPSRADSPIPIAQTERRRLDGLPVNRRTGPK